MQDVKVTLTGGSYHPTDSSEVAFEAAAILAFENATRKANPLLLEPIMRMHITAPDEYIGKVIGDLNARRAQINESTTQGPIYDRIRLTVNTKCYQRLYSIVQGRFSTRRSSDQ